jgi:Uri superfamily endonuclease
MITLKEQGRFRACGNNMLRKIFGFKPEAARRRWHILHLHNLHRLLLIMLEINIMEYEMCGSNSTHGEDERYLKI